MKILLHLKVAVNQTQTVSAGGWAILRCGGGGGVMKNKCSLNGG